MRWTFLTTAAFLLSVDLIFAQEKEHAIVFDFTKSDTASFSTMVLQLRNILAVAPKARLEVVCYGPGLDFLLQDKSNKQEDLEELQKKYKVVFAACEASLKRRGIDKRRLLPQATTVPLASLELSFRQQEGWSYLKAGYVQSP